MLGRPWKVREDTPERLVVDARRVDAHKIADCTGRLFPRQVRAEGGLVFWLCVGVRVVPQKPGFWPPWRWPWRVTFHFSRYRAGSIGGRPIHERGAIRGKCFRAAGDMVTVPHWMDEEKRA